MRAWNVIKYSQKYCFSHVSVNIVKINTAIDNFPLFENNGQELI